MTSFLIIVLLLSDIALVYLLWALHEKLEKLNANQATMLGYFDTIRKNEETLQEDLKKVYHELNARQKEISKGRFVAQTKEPVRPR